MQVFFVFFAIICGGLYFQEFLEFSGGEFAGFFVGVALILGGVYGLAPSDMVLSFPEIVEEDEALSDNEVCDFTAPAESIVGSEADDRSIVETIDLERGSGKVEAATV